MGALPQVLEIIFQMQRKMINEKITRKEKKLSKLTKHVFFLFFEPCLLSSLITFLFFIHYKLFKVL